MLHIVNGARVLLTCDGSIFLSWDWEGWALGTSFVLHDLGLSADTLLLPTGGFSDSLRPVGMFSDIFRLDWRKGCFFVSVRARR